MGATKAMEYSSDVDMAILQSRSPSCGTNEIYGLTKLLRGKPNSLGDNLGEK